MKTLRDDPLPDLTVARANWAALAIFGRDKSNGVGEASVCVNSIPLSMRSFALLLSEPMWLMTLHGGDGSY